MKTISAVLLAFAILAGTSTLRAQDDPAVEPFSAEQLDNLLAQVALYPDPLLAQVLVAATFPDQVDEAARFCRDVADPDAIDGQPWDVSVKAVAHYPTVLDMMANQLDWTTALGQAYANQPDEVMEAVQRLRQEAQDAGNLESTPQQDVDVDDGNIDIWPAQPQYIYVPGYDPSIVYVGSGGVYGGPALVFGTGYPIGVWLNTDINWRHRRIYYHGWSNGHGWIARSRPYVHINGTYVNGNLRGVKVNHAVANRPVNYDHLTRVNSVHPDVAMGSRRESEPRREALMGAGDRRRGTSEVPAAGLREPGSTGYTAVSVPRQSERVHVDAPPASHTDFSPRHSSPPPAPAIHTQPASPSPTPHISPPPAPPHTDTSPKH